MSDKIIEAIARNLFVQAYANFIEDDARTEDVSDLDRPGPGGDWYDHAPETSPAALECARKAAESIERLNGTSLEALFAQATEACKAGRRCQKRTHTPEGFGSALGFILTGTGVSWYDDHEEFPLKIPSVEFHIFSRDGLTAESFSDTVDERFVKEV